jgi:hypothetical protein
MPDPISSSKPRGAFGPAGFFFCPCGGEKITAESAEAAEETEIFFSVFFVSFAVES